MKALTRKTHTWLIGLLAAMFWCTSLTAEADNFVRTAGSNIYGRDGQRIVLRGVNCGNWMVQEPYMMNTSGTLDRQFKLHRKIAQELGQERAQQFDSLWMDNVFGEADMRFLASPEVGFNTLRVPMHYKYFTLPTEEEPVAGSQTWLDEGFRRIDSLVAWAERYGMLLILDMHACPGGQSSGDICDYDSSKPSLWESATNRTKLTALWQKLAERYADCKCIIGYDLINETNWPSLRDNGANNKALWDLTKQLITAIRRVDRNHLVIVEGNGYSNDYTGFPTAKMDARMMIQYHRYGVRNTRDQMKGMLDNGSAHSCPVFLGEFGENSNTWLRDAVQVMEENGINAWTIWPLKKTGINCLLRPERVAAYDHLIKQWQQGASVDAATAWDALRAWAEAQAFSRCTVQRDVLDALRRQPYTTDTQPYLEGTRVDDYVYAVHYDLGVLGQAYHDTDVASYQYDGEEWTDWNRGWTFRNDGVDIGGCTDLRTCGFYVGWTQDGEWLQYTLQCDAAGIYDMQLRYASTAVSTIHITVNGVEALPATKLPSTGSYTSWTTRPLKNIQLPRGEVKLRICFDRGGANLNWFHFYNLREPSAVSSPAATPPYTLHGNHICLAPHARLYNVQGQQLPEGHLAPGIYIVSHQHSQQVILVKGA